MDEDRPFEMPIDGVLDLHAFRAEEVKSLVPEYLEECRRRGILELRIIHGKGTGTLRRLVQSLLSKDPHVLSFKHRRPRRRRLGSDRGPPRSQRLMPMQTPKSATAARS